MRVRSLGGEDPLEKEMATHSGILAWIIPWTEEPGGPQSMGLQRSDTTEVTEHSDICSKHYPFSLCTYPAQYEDDC